MPRDPQRRRAGATTGRGFTGIESILSVDDTGTVPIPVSRLRLEMDQTF